MNIESVPINAFIIRALDHRRVMQVTGTWIIDNNEIIKELLNHFHTLGIFCVLPGHDKIILDAIIVQLQTNITLHQKVKESQERMEKMRRDDKKSA